MVEPHHYITNNVVFEASENVTLGGGGVNCFSHSVVPSTF